MRTWNTNLSSVDSGRVSAMENRVTRSELCYDSAFYCNPIDMYVERIRGEMEKGVERPRWGS